MKKYWAYVIIVTIVSFAYGLVVFARYAGKIYDVDKDVLQEQSAVDGVEASRQSADIIVLSRLNFEIPSEVAMLGVSTPESRQFLNRISQRLDDEEISVGDALMEVNACVDTVDRCKFVAGIIKKNNPDNSWAAINLLQGYGNSEIIQVLYLACKKDCNEDMLMGIFDVLRYLIANARDLQSKLSDKDINRLKALICQCWEKTEDDYNRAVCLGAVAILPKSSQVEFCTGIMKNGNGAMQLKLLENISEEITADTIELSILGLNSSEKDVKIQASENLQFCLGRKFKNANEASDWWRDHRGEYNFN